MFTVIAPPDTIPIVEPTGTNWDKFTSFVKSEPWRIDWTITSPTPVPPLSENTTETGAEGLMVTFAMVTYTFKWTLC